MGNDGNLHYSDIIYYKFTNNQLITPKTHVKIIGIKKRDKNGILKKLIQLAKESG